MNIPLLRLHVKRTAAAGLGGWMRHYFGEKATCDVFIEKTEEKVVSYYEEEQQKPQFTRFTIRYNQELLLNPHIQELAPIRLKNEGEADE